MDDFNAPENSEFMYDKPSALAIRLRFIDGYDSLSSDEARRDDYGTVGKLKRYNQLNPRAEFVYKHLQAIKPKTQSIWKTVNSNLCTNLSGTETMAGSNSKRKREESSSDDEGTHHVKKVSKKSFSGPNSTLNIVNRKQKSHNVSASESEEFTTPPLKNKKKKSKHQEVSSSSEMTHYNKKKVSQTLLHDNNLDLNHSNDHLLSSSESEIFVSVNKVKLKSANKVKNRSSVNFNGDTRNGIDETSTKPTENNDKMTLNAKSIRKNEALNSFESDVASIIETENTESEMEKSTSNLKKLQKNSGDLFNLKSKSNSGEDPQLDDKSYREHQFTKEDHEEMSKFSLLLREDLAEKNNIWILQCPSNIDCTGLIGEYLDLEGSCRLSDGQRDYEAFGHRSYQTRTSTFAIPIENNQLHVCKLPITGNVIIEECVKIKNDQSCVIEEPLQCVELPDNLRVRHPLLGRNFENQPKTVVRPERSPKKKKHSKHKSDFDDTSKHYRMDIISSSNSETPKKKKKKKKHKTNEDLDDTTTDYAEGFELNEISLSLINSPKKKKKKNDEITEDPAASATKHYGIDISSSSNSETPKKKKKKKHKTHEDTITDTPQQDATEVERTPKKKKKRKSNPQDDL